MWHNGVVLRIAFVSSLLVCVACSPGGETSTKTTVESTPDADLTAAEDSPSDDTGGPDPVVEIAVDETNRFVREDLDRFMREFPDVLRERDEALFQTCRADGCLEHGVSDSVTPFTGAGVRYLVPLWLRGCLSGSAQACLFAGRTYQGSQWASDDGGRGRVHESWSKDELRARFRQYIERACLLDDTQCEQWADYTLGDERPASDQVARAIALLEAGCGRRAAGSCAALARHAGDHAEIGHARPWWKKACEYEEKRPNRACSRYASALLVAGSSEDRAAAIEALGPTCDPSTETWARACEGEPQTGAEACESTYLHEHGHACVQLAPSLPEREALRLLAAMCVGSILDETNAIGRRACDGADRLARKLGRSTGFKRRLARRRCEVDFFDCISSTHDLRACNATQASCETAATDG